ncbi:hypothetical protein A0H81_00689 [Grifola frondosa]|uniref:MARVEL domain-containing protein n=1 Tax=Grifola frondosa TaxID=5627 RepID=A0A1C7MQI4_GRIFR|nr:hypothetical protein A0H81_00689 [Grifola frondosa]
MLGMHWLQLARLVTLSWTIFCAVIILGLSADVTSVGNNNFSGYFTYGALGIATALLALLTVPPMLVIDLLRTGAFTSMIAVELSWLGFLWIMFLATGGSAADSAANFWGSCSFWSTIGLSASANACRETSGIAAFGFLAWIVLLGYFVALLTMSIIHATRGHHVWTVSLKQANFDAFPDPPTTAPNMEDKAPENVVLQPQPSAYPPAGYLGQPTTPQPGHPQV